jgi:hypothetical protein
MGGKMIEKKRIEYWQDAPLAKRIQGRLLLRPQRAGRVRMTTSPWMCFSGPAYQDVRWQVIDFERLVVLEGNTRAQAAEAAHSG